MFHICSQIHCNVTLVMCTKSCTRQNLVRKEYLSCIINVIFNVMIFCKHWFYIMMMFWPNIKVLSRQSHCKKYYLQDSGRPSSTFLAHLFGKTDSFLLFCSLRSPRKRGSSKTARKNQFCQTNVRGKLLKN